VAGCYPVGPWHLDPGATDTIASTEVQTMLRKIASAISLSLVLAGCALEPVALKPQARAELQSVESLLLIPKESLDVTVTSTYLGGGLVEGLIALYVDKKRQESAQVAASPILDALAGYDFRVVMRDAWAAEFAKVGNAEFRAPTLVDRAPSDAAELSARKRADLERSDADAVLFAHIDYSLLSGTLVIKADLEIYPKSLALKKYRASPADSDPLNQGNVVYRNSFSFKKEFISQTNIRRGLDEGAHDIARRVAADIARLQPQSAAPVTGGDSALKVPPQGSQQ
jgi:hypothetical protein